MDILKIAAYVKLNSCFLLLPIPLQLNSKSLSRKTERENLTLKIF